MSSSSSSSSSFGRHSSSTSRRTVVVQFAVVAVSVLVAGHLLQQLPASTQAAGAQGSFEFADFCQRLCLWGRGGNLCRCNAVHFVGKRRPQTSTAAADWLHLITAAAAEPADVAEQNGSGNRKPEVHRKKNWAEADSDDELVKAAGTVSQDGGRQERLQSGPWRNRKRKIGAELKLSTDVINSDQPPTEVSNPVLLVLLFIVCIQVFICVFIVFFFKFN